MIEEGLRAATSTELHDWINEHDPDAPRFQRFWEEEAEAKNETELKKALFKYIRTNIEDFTKLARECRSAGVGLRYLPAYYPECNPIELIWAHIKREFKATSVDMPWKERLEMAHSKITEEQIELSFDSAVRSRTFPPYRSLCLWRDRLGTVCSARAHPRGGGRVVVTRD